MNCFDEGSDDEPPSTADHIRSPFSMSNALTLYPNAIDHRHYNVISRPLLEAKEPASRGTRFFFQPV